MPSDTKRMGGPALNAAAPPERKTSRDPMRSPQSTALHPMKEDVACTANPNQISSTRLHLVEGVRASRVSHHSDTALIADTNPIADTTLIAGAPCPASHIAEIPPCTLQEETSGQNSETDGNNTNAVTSTESSETEVPGAEDTHYKELPRPPIQLPRQRPQGIHLVPYGKYGLEGL